MASRFSSFFPGHLSVPNPNPKKEHLEPGWNKGLEKARGVPKLREGEISRTVRVRGDEALFEKLESLTPIEIGELLEQSVEQTSLFKKYMVHIEDQEGINFVDRVNEPHNAVELSEEEVWRLKALSGERSNATE